ncbi:MAG: proton-conducting transporter membrane subunit [Candidatus Krumholzibacteriota bacterium]
MVNPVLLVAVPLAAAFLLPLFGKVGRAAARTAQVLTIVFTAAVSVSWIVAFASGAAPEPLNILTGGYDGPIGINLHYGLPEAIFCLLASLTTLAGSLYLGAREDAATVGRSGLLQLLIMVGAFGLIMTRDLFNLFVFLEIASIGTYALVAFGKEEKALEAGFKYMLIGAAASAFLLIGIAFLYKMTGTLNIDDMAGKMPAAATAGLATVMLFLLAGMAIELKLLPVNGPALDLYDGAEPGVMALLVGTTVNGVLFAFWKMSSLFPGSWDTAIMALGMITFVGSNLLATGQDRPRRMLGYSSSGQIGLVVFLIPLIRLDVVPLAAAGLLLINHTLAKTGLLWLAGCITGDGRKDWLGAFRGSVAGRTALIVFILAIVGLPPFPGFWGKWQALSGMAANGFGWWIVPLLIGSLLEFVYYFGWYRRVQSSRPDEAPMPGSLRPLADLAGVVPFALGSLVFGLWTLRHLAGPQDQGWLFLAAAGAVLIIVRRLPQTILSATVLGALAVAGWVLFTAGSLVPSTPGGLFLLMVMTGAVVTALAGLGRINRRDSYQGLFLILVASLVMLTRAESLLAFFVAWEVMTWASYLIIGFGRNGARASQLYIVFSGAAGFLLLGGMMLAIGAGQTTLTGLGFLTGGAAVWVWGLLVVGFLVKAAAWGAHVWAPGAYSESPDLFTPFLSGVISKIPMFGLAMAAFRIGAGNLPALGATLDATWLLAVVGGVTAFGMTLVGVFQEDAKKLLAYSSVGQVGYIVVGLAVLTPLGWTAALFHAVHHLLFKGLLFLAIAGVVMRTGTRTMYEMGGLIKKMPMSFISVLIGIIALSGVPPLAGFTGKWLLYQALLERGWLFILVLMMFASVVAFVYLFRLIHTVFLGQLKTVHQTVKEAPLPLALAQVLLIGAIMALSVYPQLLLQPLDTLVTGQFNAGALTFAEGGALVAGAGQFNPVNMMILVIVLFAVMVLLLLVLGPKTRKVGQLDIVYQGEIPPPPEELHYASRFAQPYRRAWEPLLVPRVTAFWASLADNTQGVVDVLRRVYSGNGQTYVMYSVLMVVVFHLLGLGR